MSSGKRLIPLHKIHGSDTYQGRMVDLNGLVGRIEGSFTVGDRVVLRMRIGGLPAFSDAYDPETCVEVWKESP